MLLLIATASAYIYGGNPSFTFDISNLYGGTVEVDKVRMHRCSGGYVEVDVFETLTLPTDTWTISVDGGDYCEAEILFGLQRDVDGDDYDGVIDPPSLMLDIDHSGPYAMDVPVDVTNGFIYGGNPSLTMVVD